MKTIARPHRVALFSNVVFLFCLFFIIAVADSRATETVTEGIARKVVAVIPADLPPTYFLDKSGRPAGFAIDVMNELGQRSGLTIEYIVTKGWDEAIQLVLDGKADIIPSLTINEQRTKILAFTKTIDSLVISLVVTSGNTGVQGITPGLTIGVLNGSTPHNFLKKNSSITLETYNDLNSMIFGLLAGHVDGIVSLTNSIMKLAMDAGIDEKLKIVGEPVIEAKRAVATRKEETELLNRLNSEIDVFVDSPEYQKLYVKWYGKPSQYWNGTRMAVLIVGLLVVLTTAFLIWRKRSVQLLLNTRTYTSKLEQRLSLATSAAEIGVWDWLVPENVLIWDEWMYRLYGVKEEDFSGAYEAWVKGLHPDDVERCEAGIREALVGENEYHIEFRVVWPNGTVRHIKAFGLVERDVQGAPLRMIGVNYDITNLKQAESALLQANAKTTAINETLNAIIFTMSDWVWELNSEGVYTYSSPHVEAVLGYKPEELIGKKYHDFMVPEEAERLGWIIDRVVQGKENVRNLEKWSTHKDGHQVLLNTNAVPVCDESGNLCGYRGVGQDITENRRMARELQRSHNELAATLDTIPDLLFKVDREGTFLQVHAANESMLLIPKTELLGKKLKNLLPPEAVATISAALKQAEERGTDYGRIMMLPLEQGEYWFELSVAFNNKIANEAPYFIVLSRDVSERKRNELELERARSTADIANQAKSRFLANMSHEIRTPMNGIIGMGYLALEEDLSDKAYDYLNKITYSAVSLMGILNDILDFSKIEANMLAIEEVEFSTVKLLENISTLHRIAAENKGLELILPHPESLPALLIGDPLRVQQIINNLINNAIKFTSAGSVTLTAAVNEENGGADRLKIAFTVRDTGMGISPEQQELLFLPFTQSDTSTTREFGGTGLGLSICQSLVHLMGGELTVSSVPGAGSSFSFSVWCGRRSGQVTIEGDTLSEKKCTAIQNSSVLPVGDVAPTHSPHRMKQAYPQRDKFAGVRVLLVDDNAINTQLASELLERVGVTVTTAANGREAVAKVTEGEGAFDLVLMDVQMPVMDGYTAARQIRERWSASRLPIVAMTAHAMSEERERCLDSGMNDLLTKPVNPDSLFKMVALMTERHPLPESVCRSSVPPSSLTTLPVVDFDDVLKRCMGETYLMMRTLTSFSEGGQKTVDDLLVALEREKRDEIKIHGHTLKGLSGNIGAFPLNSLCKELEARLQSGGTCEELHDFEGTIREEMARIMDVIKAASTMNGGTAVEHGADGTVTETVAALRTALEDMDSKALQLAQSLAGQLSASTELARLLRQVNAIDFDGALVTLDSISLENAG